MQATQGGIGRVFVLRLEDGDLLPDSIEDFAACENIEAAFCAFLGGAEDGSRIVVGPEDENERPLRTMTVALGGVHEALGVGTIFQNEAGAPKLHMHAAFGRGDEVKAGCVRPGVGVWTIGEVVIMELVGTDMRRVKDPRLGFELLAKG